MKQLADRLRALPVVERRRFLKAIGAALAAPLAPSAVRFLARELEVSEARAQSAEQGTLFLEVNLRDQLDLMHVMVPPSIAKYPNRSVGTRGQQLSMFAPQSELKEFPNNVFLTNDSLELGPHIDSVAMLDTGEAAIGGVHGHEAGNGMRSPGRKMDAGASGRPPMWLGDAPTEGSHAAGSEELYSWSPTPASFHNYYQHKLGARIDNGFAFKGISRYKHNVYHYGAGLPSSELTRVFAKDDLLTRYGGSVALPEKDPLLAAIRARPQPPYRKSSGAGYAALRERYGSIEPLSAQTYPLDLTAEEIARWSAGVPPQFCAHGDIEIYTCPEDFGKELDRLSDIYSKAQIWQQFAYASKLLRGGRVRSIALEFDDMDLEGDDARPEQVLRTYAQQVARPLARLIEDLKAAQLYDRTIIAIYTTDGSRTPAANSYGNDGKGTILLAGGRVRGGYYGDITITGSVPDGGHTYAFRAPDPKTGELLPSVTNWGDPTKRTPSGAVWRTVVQAAGIPEAEYSGKFDPLIDEASALSFMLKS